MNYLQLSVETAAVRAYTMVLKQSLYKAQQMDYILIFSQRIHIIKIYLIGDGYKL